MKNNYLKTSLVLGSICAVSAILLALFNMITKPVIDEYELNAKLAARQEVSCGLKVEEEIPVVDSNNVLAVCPLSENGKITGYVLELKDHGYGGEINVTASYDVKGKIMAVKFGSNSETPGVGKRYEDSDKLVMFEGKGSEIDIPATKKILSTEETALVTGATVTFLGISRALKTGSEYVKNIEGGR